MKFEKRASKYPMLNDGDWLRSQYIGCSLSLSQIAKLAGCLHCNVRAALLKHGVPLRTKGDGQKNRYKQNGFDDHFVFAQSVIEGCLLGDGSLRAENVKSDDSVPYFSKKNKHYDHVMFVANKVFAKNVKDRVTDVINYGYTPSGTPAFFFSTLTHASLRGLYREWYPAREDHKKIVPQSLKVNAEVLLHWFLDDGYSYWVNRQDKSSIRVQFATQSFSKDDLDVLVEKVKNEFGLLMYPRLHRRHGVVKGTGWQVDLSEKRQQVAMFFDIVGPPPVPSLSYKWKSFGDQDA